jgi:hypothetical protein
MKLYVIDSSDVSQKKPSAHQENIKYGTLLVLGIPAIVFGSRYIVEGLFKWLW